MRRARRSRWRLTLAALLIVGVPVACGDSESSEMGEGEVPGWSIARALEEIPDDHADQFDVYVADLRRADDLLGLQRPDDLSDLDAVWADWLMPLTGYGEIGNDRRHHPLWVQVPPPVFAELDQLSAFEQLVGWSLLDVDSLIDYRPPPAPYLVVSRGTFPRSALAGLDEVAPNVFTVGDGVELAFDFDGAHPLDKFGRPVRLARDGDRIAVSLATGVVRQWLTGSGRRLADDDDLLAVATALDGADVVYAHLSRHDRNVDLASFGVDESEPDAYDEFIDLVVISEPFDTVGIGWSVTDDDEPRVVIVYAARSERAAADLADQVGQAYERGVSLVRREPIAELWGITDLRVTVDHEVVVVTYIPHAAFWTAAWQGAVSGDTPFAHR